MNGKMKGKMKGSLTVEAVFVISIILLVILWIMKAAIVIYQQTLETAAVDWLEIENAADTFRKLFFAGKLLP